MEAPQTGSKRSALVENIPIIFSGIALILSMASPAIGQYATSQVNQNRLNVLEERVQRLEDWQQHATLDIAGIAGDIKSINKSLAGIDRFLDKWTHK